MQLPLIVFHVLYWIVSAPCADDATVEEAEDKKDRSPAMEYG